jgi:acetyl-CoA carboxylase biotin carboxyl carrier protein
MSRERRLDLDEIRALIQLAADADIAELDVDVPHLKVRIKKAARTPQVPAAPAGPDPAAAPAARTDGAGAPAAPDQGTPLVPIAAPMVGTFYRAPKPDAPPFVSEGDTVRVGQTVCVLEAMKLFNEITSQVAGRIARVLVENGAPVEYGQPLFFVDPS